MRIGILTFHRAHNYGAVLQCYCLQEYLNSIGHEGCVIDYRPSYIERPYSFFQFGEWYRRGWKTLVKYSFMEPVRLWGRMKRRRLFNSFINERYNLIPFTPGFKNCDMVIIGSDQVWNPIITGGAFDPVFWGRTSDVPTVSYAVSLGKKELSEKEMEFAGDSLSRFKGISVREMSLQSIIREKFNVEASLVIDPTLLAGVDIIDNIVVRPKYTRPFLLYYGPFEALVASGAVKSLASQFGGTVIEVSSLSTYSPGEFSGLVKYSESVVTSSFHGVALSLLYGKPFYYIRQNSDSDIRVFDLLDYLNLSSRIINVDDEPVFTELDVANVNKKMAVLRQESVAFLRECINS